jgi:hypothetical protein
MVSICGLGSWRARNSSITVRVPDPGSRRSHGRMPSSPTGTERRPASGSPGAVIRRIGLSRKGSPESWPPGGGRPADRDVRTVGRELAEYPLADRPARPPQARLRPSAATRRGAAGRFLCARAGGPRGPAAGWHVRAARVRDDPPDHVRGDRDRARRLSDWPIPYSRPLGLFSSNGLLLPVRRSRPPFA